MEKRWVKYDCEYLLDCPLCGDVIEVFTSLSDDEIREGLYEDSDSVRCTDQNCDLKNGQVTVDKETEPYIVAN